MRRVKAPAPPLREDTLASLLGAIAMTGKEHREKFVAAYGPWGQVGAAWADAASELGAEAMRFLVQRVAADVGLQQRLLAARSLPELRHIHAEFVQKAIDDRSSMGAIGSANMQSYLQYKTGQAIGNAGQGGGGEAGSTAQAGMGLGMGAGLGMLIPQIIQQAGQQAPQQVLLCSNCQAKVAEGAKFCPNCGIQFGVGQACSKCNAPLTPGAKFCPQCGQQVG